MSTPEIIRHVSILSVALPLFQYCFKARHASRPVHIIGVLTIVSALSDAIAYILFEQDVPTVILFNAYYTVLFFLLSWFYYEILSTKIGRTTVLAGLAIYFISFIFVTLYLQGSSEYQTVMWTITGIIMTIFSLTYFLSLFSASSDSTSNELLWFNSGILFYFSFNLSLFIMSNHVLSGLAPQLSLLIWSFHNINNIIKNILFGFGMSSSGKEKTLMDRPFTRT